MWSRSSRGLFPEQVDAIAGQANPVHPVLQAVLVQAHQGVPRFTAEGLHPGAALKPLIRLSDEDRPGPVHRHLEGTIQHRRMVGAHRLLPAEQVGSPASALTLFAQEQIGFRLLGPDTGARQGEAGKDGVGDATVVADAAQDPQGLCVVVLPVGGVFFQFPDPLTGRAGGGAKQNDKLAADFIEVVDVPLDVEYNNICVFQGGTKN